LVLISLFHITLFLDNFILSNYWSWVCSTNWNNIWWLEL